MVPFRLLVRFKIFQLAGVAALAVPINTFLSDVRSSEFRGVCGSVCMSRVGGLLVICPQPHSP